MKKNVLLKCIYLLLILCFAFPFCVNAQKRTKAAPQKAKAGESKNQVLSFGAVQFLASNDMLFVYNLAENAKIFVTNLKFEGTALQMRQGFALWLKRNPEIAARIYFYLAAKHDKNEYSRIRQLIVDSDLYVQLLNYANRDFPLFYSDFRAFSTPNEESLKLHNILNGLKRNVKDLTNYLNKDGSLQKANSLISAVEKMLGDFDVQVQKFNNAPLTREALVSFNKARSQMAGNIAQVYICIKKAEIGEEKNRLLKNSISGKNFKGIIENVNSKYVKSALTLEQNGNYIYKQYEKIQNLIDKGSFSLEELPFLFKMSEDVFSAWSDKIYIYENLPKIIDTLSRVRAPRLLDEVMFYFSNKHKYNEKYLKAVVDVGRYKQFISLLVNAVIDDNFNGVFELLRTVSPYNTPKSGLQVLSDESKISVNTVNSVREMNLWLARLMFGGLFYSPADDLSAAMRSIVEEKK